MRPITKEDLFEKTTIRIVPGPGAHNFTAELNPEGKYYPGKFKSSGSKVWNPLSSQRFYKSSKCGVKQRLMFRDLGTTTLSWTTCRIPGSTCCRSTRGTGRGGSRNRSETRSWTSRASRRKVRVCVCSTWTRDVQDSIRLRAVRQDKACGG